MTRGQKKLRAEQENRARDLYAYLGRFGVTASSDPLKAIEAITDWLARDYRLGMDAQRRDARKRRDAIGSGRR